MPYHIRLIHWHVNMYLGIKLNRYLSCITRHLSLSHTCIWFNYHGTFPIRRHVNIHLGIMLNGYLNCISRNLSLSHTRIWLNYHGTFVWDIIGAVIQLTWECACRHLVKHLNVTDDFRTWSVMDSKCIQTSCVTTWAKEVPVLKDVVISRSLITRHASE